MGLFTFHPERYVLRGFEWIRRQRSLRPDSLAHASRFVPECPWVHHWWEGARGGGGSAWGARKLAWLMGFEPIVLVGCPLLPGNYAGYKLGMIMTDVEVTERYVAEIAEDRNWHEGVSSASGRTRDILGAPC